MHNLVKVMGETKVVAKARARGRQASNNELWVIIAQIRNFLSATFLKYQSLCLINRLGYLEDIAKAAADVGSEQEEGPPGPLPGPHQRTMPVQGCSQTILINNYI